MQSRPQELGVGWKREATRLLRWHLDDSWLGFCHFNRLSSCGTQVTSLGGCERKVKCSRVVGTPICLSPNSAALIQPSQPGGSWQCPSESSYRVACCKVLPKKQGSFGPYFPKHYLTLEVLTAWGDLRKTSASRFLSC